MLSAVTGAGGSMSGESASGRVSEGLSNSSYSRGAASTMGASGGD